MRKAPLVIDTTNTFMYNVETRFAVFNKSKKRLTTLFDKVLDEIPFIDREDQNLIGTPERLARMYLDVFWGLDPTNKPRMTTFPVEGDNGLVGTGKIFFTSFCAHHFMPFVGAAYIYYIPDKYLAGVSKFTRIVQYYAARPQIQERLAVQIADHIMEEIKPLGAYVILRASHSCMQARGVRQEQAMMVTNVIRPLNKSGQPIGPFSLVEVRQEALDLFRMST